MAKFGSGKKPKNQGSSSGVHTQKPGTSSKPSKGGEAPTTAQNHRGSHTPGKGGTGTFGSPKPFKG